MARRIVAFLDVLGFKTLVEQVPQPELVEIYQALQRAARQQTTLPVFPEDRRQFEEEPYYEDHEIARRRTVNVVMVSDSIVLYSAGESYTDVVAVAGAVRGLLLSGFCAGVPLRGALTIGALDEVDLADDAHGQGWTADFAALVGLGLVRAYQLEGRFNWSGAILHPDLVEHLDTVVLGRHEGGPLSALDHLCCTQLALETAAPVKHRRADGTVQVEYDMHWAVHWPFLADAIDWSVGEHEVAAAFTSFGREATADVAAKRDETIAFMRRAEAEADATRHRRLERWRS